MAVMVKRPKKSWDQGVSYEEIKTRLLELIEIARFRASLGYEKAKQRLANLYVLLVQLENAARISEAYEAYMTFLATGMREIPVRVRKRKDETYRLIMIPPEIPENAPAPVSIAAVKVFAREVLGVNTHTLRYARITHMARLGVPAQIIGRITEHKKLDMILRYTQKVEAEKTLRQLVLGHEVGKARAKASAT